MTAKVAAESVLAGAATYRYTKNPVTIGQLRHKVWRYLIEPIDDNPIWVARCGNYWTIQQETFGLTFSPYTLVVDREAQCVITYAVLLDVLPGKREVDYVCPRVREGRQAKQPPLTEGSQP